jgi:hypothetical protein
MTNPPPPSLGYSVTVTPSNPDSSTPQPVKNSAPPPTMLPGAPRFPPPKLQQDQIPSPFFQNPNLLSPANGVRSPVPHLSTPPGPPVFKSPVRPAAVPFRTSPATPQPIAFSSGSTLPTSSPPHFSNGSVELQHQVPLATEDSTLVNESSCALFSAHKVSLSFSLLFKLKAPIVVGNFFLFCLYEIVVMILRAPFCLVNKLLSDYPFFPDASPIYMLESCDFFVYIKVAIFN